MPASASPSRHRHERIADLNRRMGVLRDVLDTLPDRGAPLSPRLAQRSWRVVDEACRALRLPLPPESDRGREPWKLVVQLVLILPLLTHPKALRNKAPPAAKQKRYPRAVGWE